MPCGPEAALPAGFRGTPGVRFPSSRPDVLDVLRPLPGIQNLRPQRFTSELSDPGFHQPLGEAQGSLGKDKALVSPYS